MPNFENHPLFPGDAVPLFIAAGPLKEAADFGPFLHLEDPLIVPLLTNGGWVMDEWPGNARSEGDQDFVYYPERRMAGNCRGLPCSGLDGLRKLGEPIRQLSDRGIKTIIQVTNLPHEKGIDVIPQLVEEAAEQHPTGIEVNLSCPNGKDGRGNLHPPTCNDPDASGEIMAASRARVGDEITLGAKDSSHASSLDSGIDVAAINDLVVAINPYINFLTGINTIGGQPFPELECGGGKGGMSGPVVANIAKDWLIAARNALSPDVPILSCGGVDSNNAAVEIPVRLELGALLVGGAQEFFRSPNPANLALRWAQEYAEYVK